MPYPCARSWGSCVGDNRLRYCEPQTAKNSSILDRQKNLESTVCRDLLEEMPTVGRSVPGEFSNGGIYQAYTTSPELQVVGRAFRHCICVLFGNGTNSHECAPVIALPLNAMGRTRVPNPLEVFLERVFGMTLIL